MTWFLQDEAETIELLGQRFRLPEDYLVADIETSGFSVEQDLIVAAGWLKVSARKPSPPSGVILDWTRCDFVDRQRLRSQLIRVEQEFAATGRTWHYPWERLAAEGVDPMAGLHSLVTVLYEALVAGLQIAGHNFWQFDRRRLDHHTGHFMNGYLLPWRANSIYDTGLLEKAAQLARPPWQGESLDDWSRRVYAARVKGCKWNLTPHCVTKYRLPERYGIDMSLAHTHGFDCLLSHYVIETFREIMEILGGTRKYLSQEAARGGQALY